MMFAQHGIVNGCPKERKRPDNDEGRRMIASLLRFPSAAFTGRSLPESTAGAVRSPGRNAPAAPFALRRR